MKNDAPLPVLSPSSSPSSPSPPPLSAHTKALALLLGLMLAGCVRAPARAPDRSAPHDSPSSANPSSGPIQLAAFASSDPPGGSVELAAFASFQPIDAHVHLLKLDPELVPMLTRLNLTVIDILLVDDTGDYPRDLDTERRAASALVQAGGGRIAICTTFDPFGIGDPAALRDSQNGVSRDIAQGAVGVKVWKNVGMEVKDAGKFVMPDDPRLSPIYQEIANDQSTLIMHVGDPDIAWEPADPLDPEWHYFKNAGPWRMYDRDVPSKATLLAARDHVLAENPSLRVVGAHLGSLESHLDQLGKTLDTYPNLAVDLAARMKYLWITPRDVVLAFFLRYQDRILYGTDNQVREDSDPGAMRSWERVYARDMRYLAEGGSFKGNVEGNAVTVQGLALPLPVLRKILHDNALRWFPGLAQTAASTPP